MDAYHNSHVLRYRYNLMRMDLLLGDKDAALLHFLYIKREAYAIIRALDESAESTMIKILKHEFPVGINTWEEFCLHHLPYKTHTTKLFS